MRDLVQWLVDCSLLTCLLSCRLHRFMTWLIASTRHLDFRVLFLCWVKTAEMSQCCDGHWTVSKLERVFLFSSQLFTLCLLYFCLSCLEPLCLRAKPLLVTFRWVGPRVASGAWSLAGGHSPPTAWNWTLHVVSKAERQRGDGRAGLQLFQTATLLSYGPSGWF